ncbi:phosphotransferase, partial [Actinomadura adrarensis]
GLDVGDAAASVTELAVLHAAGWENPALAVLDWLNRYDPAAVEFTAEMVTGMYAGFRDRYENDLAPKTITAIEEFLPRMASYLTDRQGPATLTHGDFRADNLLFGGPRPAVLDWQTCAFGSGALDLAYFLGSSLPTQARREHERTLVKGYHSVLTERGVKLDWDECWDGYRKHAFQGIVMGIGASMLVERTDRGDRMFCTMIDRHAAHIIDLNCLSLLP